MVIPSKFAPRRRRPVNVDEFSEIKLAMNYANAGWNIIYFYFSAKAVGVTFHDKKQCAFVDFGKVNVLRKRKLLRYRDTLRAAGRE